MSDLTTAQRLAAYRDELLAAGFNAREVWEIVEAATPLFDDVTVEPDLDADISTATEATFFDKPVRLQWPEGLPLGVTRKDLAEAMNEVAKALLRRGSDA